MSIVRDFDKLKRFNVEQLYDQYQESQGKSTKKGTKVGGAVKSESNTEKVKAEIDGEAR